MRSVAVNPHDPALRMTYPGFVFRTLVNEGHDLSTLLAHAGLTEDALADPDFRTGWAPLRQFFRNAVDLTGDPHLGLRLAQKFEANFIGLPAYAAMNAATFADALQVLHRFFFLTFPAIEFTLADAEAAPPRGTFAIRLRPRLPMDDIAYFTSSSALIACHGLLTAILRRPALAVGGTLCVGQPEGWDKVAAQVGFPIRFDSPGIWLFLPDTLLTMALPGADPLNHRRLVDLCDEVAARASDPPTPLGKIMAFLQDAPGLDLPIADVAARLGYSERGLRRQLARAGTTFRAVTDDIREQRANAMLTDPAIPIKTIAAELGYDTPSNFARSYKRRTGISPTAFRQAKAAKDDSGQK